MATDTQFTFLDNAITKLHSHFTVYIDAMRELGQLKEPEIRLARCIFTSLLHLELFANKPIVTLGEDTVPEQQLQQRTTLGYQLVRSVIENKAIQGITTDTAGVKNIEARRKRATDILQLDSSIPNFEINKKTVLRFLGAREVTKPGPKKKPSLYIAIPYEKEIDLTRWKTFCVDPNFYDSEISVPVPDVPEVQNYDNGDAVNAHVIPIKTNVLKNQALKRSLQELVKEGIITDEHLTGIMNAFYNNLVAIPVGKTLNYSDLFLLLMYNTNTKFAGPQASRIAMASIVEAAKDIFACLNGNTSDIILNSICKSIDYSTYYPIASAYLGHVEYGEEKIADILAIMRTGGQRKNDDLSNKLDKRREQIIHWLEQQELSTTAAALAAAAPATTASATAASADVVMSAASTDVVMSAEPAALIEEAADKALDDQSLIAENAKAFEKAEQAIEQAIEGHDLKWLREQREKAQDKYSMARQASMKENKSQDDEFMSKFALQHITHLKKLATDMETLEESIPPVLQRQYSYVDDAEKCLMDLSIELSEQMTTRLGSANTPPFPKCREMETVLTEIYRTIFGTEPKMVGLSVTTTVRDIASPDIKQNVNSFIIRLNLAHKTVIPLMTEIMHHVVTLFQMDGYGDTTPMSIQNLGILIAEQASYKESVSDEYKDKAMIKLINIITTQEFIIGLLSILMLKRVISSTHEAEAYYTATDITKDIKEIIETMKYSPHNQDNITMWRSIINKDSIRALLSKMVDWPMETKKDKLHFNDLRDLVDDTRSGRHTQSFNMRMHQAIIVIHNMAQHIIQKYKPHKRKANESLHSKLQESLSKKSRKSRKGGNKTKKSKPKNLENLNQKIKNKKQKKHKTRNAKNRKSFFNKTLKKY